LLIWATRGRTWGFRFLLAGGLSDPLPHYEKAFGEVGDAPTAYVKDSRQVALRFPDPLRRRDAASRVIPHEFIVPRELGVSINSVESGVLEIWPLVSDTYARFWDKERPPSAAEVLRDVTSRSSP
jgi:hypothetical protein